VAVERTLAVRPVPLVALTAQLSTAEALAPGETMQVVLGGRDARGRRVEQPTGLLLAWSSSAPMVARVDEDGTVHAVGEGRATVTVRATPPATTDPVGQVLEATVAVVVAPEAVAVLEPSRSMLELEIGATEALSVVARSRRGAVLTGRAMQWRAESAAIAEVVDGRVTGRAMGETRIVATCEGITVAVPVTVRALGVHALAIDPVAASLFVGDTVALTAVATDRTGAAVRGAGITWSSNAAAIAHVSPSGVVTGNAPGEAVVVARSGSVKAQATVVVDAVPVVAMSISPDRGTLLVGRALPLDLTARDARDREVTTLAMWTASPSSIASVSADGTVTGRAPGVVTITATRGEVRAVATFTIEEAVPTTLTVAAPPGPLVVGARTTLTAKVAAADGGAVSGRVAWTSSDPLVARVSAEGVVEALSPGAARIEARAAGLVSGTSVTVIAAPVKKPLPLGLIGGGVAVLAAIVAGVMLSGGSGTGEGGERPSTPTGGAEPGVVAAAPTVEPPPAASPAPDPAPPPAAVVPPAGRPDAEPPPVPSSSGLTITGGGAVSLRESRQLVVQGGTGALRWSSSDADVVSVDAAGRVRALRLGAATVTVREGRDRSARSSVRVVGSHDDSVAAGLVARTAEPVPAARAEPAPTAPVAPAPTPAPTPAAPAPVAASERGPSDGDVARLTEQWVEQLKAARGRGAPSSIAGFFRTGTNHDVTMAGGPGAGARDGDTREATVTLDLKKTGGAGELRRARVTVTLVIGGSGGAARVVDARAGEVK
jgi:uncharacterized protein YjdB